MGTRAPTRATFDHVSTLQLGYNLDHIAFATFNIILSHCPLFCNTANNDPYAGCQPANSCGCERLPPVREPRSGTLGYEKGIQRYVSSIHIDTNDVMHTDNL